MTNAIGNVRDTTTAPHATSSRRPLTAITAAGLATLAGLVGGYGAVHFTALDGWTPMSETYVVTYEATSAFGLVCAVLLLFGRPRLRSAARYGLVAYGVWLTYFTLFKIIRFTEYQAIPFGVVGLAILGLALSPGVRRWAA